MLTTKYDEIFQNAEKSLKEAQTADISAKSGDRWSIKEIVGHLIDSAINNYRRFLIASKTDHLVFDGYDQEYWVEVQKYQDWEYDRLLLVWGEFNRMILDLLEKIPEDVVMMERAEHCLN